LISLSPERAVAASPGEHDADCVVFLVLGQRGKEGIDRVAVLARRRRPGYPKASILQLQCGIRRDDVHPIRIDHHAVLGFDDRDGGGLSQYLRQQALVVRGEMLNQDERHATVHRHGGKKRSKGVEAAGRGADADDQPVALLTWLRTRSAHSLTAL
jgi:hypothetical protein